MMVQLRFGLMVGLLLMAMMMQAVGADLSKRKAPPPERDIPYGSVYNWSGLYYGGTVGSADGGAALSGHVGYNWMMPSRFVFGVEGDLGYLGEGDSHASSGLFGTLRGRVGYAFGRFMPYATAGVAFVDGDHNSGSGTAMGIGAEYAFTPGISGRLEYLSLDTGSSHNQETNILRAGLSMRF